MCVQKQADHPIWLKGAATTSRSPIVHIGDSASRHLLTYYTSCLSDFIQNLFIVQRVRLIGEPPKDVVCFFRHLRNVVVLPSNGTLKIDNVELRSLVILSRKQIFGFLPLRRRSRYHL